MLIAQRLVFTERELLNNAILRDALEMSLLVVCNRLSANHEKQYRLSHLTLQESLAALYVFFTGVMTSRKIVQLVEFIFPDAGNVRKFWMLLAAKLNSDCLETLVNSLMTREKWGKALPTCLVVSEGNGAKFPLNLHTVLCERLSPPKHEPLANLLLSDIASSHGAQYVRSKMSRNEEPSNSAFLKTLLETCVAEVPIHNSATLLAALNRLDTCTSRYCEDLIENPSAIEVSGYSLPLPECADYSLGVRFGARRMLAFRCFAAHAQHHKDRVQSSRSIAASLEHTWGAVELNGDDKPSQSCVTDSVFRHHASSVRNIELKRFSASSACQTPLSLHQANNVSTLGVYRCSPASLVCDALHACSSNLTDLTLEIDVSEEASEHLASAFATCSKVEKFAIGYCEDIALPSLESVVKSLPRLRRSNPFCSHQCPCWVAVPRLCHYCSVMWPDVVYWKN